MQLLSYIPIQIIGGITGTVLSHLMFNIYELYSFNGIDRDSMGEFISEIVSTFGLVLTIIGCIYSMKKEVIPAAVAMYICEGILSTHSSSFANPAITIARSFTSTFTGIAPKTLPNFISAQFIGLILSLPFSEWLFGKKTLMSSFCIFL